MIASAMFCFYLRQHKLYLVFLLHLLLVPLVKKIYILLSMMVVSRLGPEPDQAGKGVSGETMARNDSPFDMQIKLLMIGDSGESFATHYSRECRPWGR